MKSLSEKDNPVVPYYMWQNWQKNIFAYHVDINKYGGIIPIFDLDLDESTSKKISHLCVTLNEKEISEFLIDLFKTLKQFDDIKIKIPKMERDGKLPNYSIRINIPYNILILKFLRELLCNPFTIMYLFSTDYQFIDGIYSLFSKILNRENGANILKFKLFLLSIAKVMDNDESLKSYVKLYTGINVDWWIYDLVVKDCNSELMNSMTERKLPISFDKMYNDKKKEFKLIDFINQFSQEI